MATYNKNFQNMMGGHLDILDNDGNPKVRQVTGASPDKDTLDIREILSNVVGRGYKSLSDGNVRADYAKLTNIVGMSQARQLFDHAIIFNQSANTQSPAESRIQAFFAAPAADKNVQSMLNRVSQFGDGVIAGLRRSPNVVNQQMAGTYDDISAINQRADEIKDVATKNVKDVTVKAN